MAVLAPEKRRVEDIKQYQVAAMFLTRKDARKLATHMQSLLDKGLAADVAFSQAWAETLGF